MVDPEFFRRMPLGDLAVSTARARMVASGDALVIFYEFEAATEVPTHAHGAQWGVVLEGRFELTVGDATRTVSPGDTDFIPAGVRHGNQLRVRGEGDAGLRGGPSGDLYCFIREARHPLFERERVREPRVHV